MTMTLLPPDAPETQTDDARFDEGRFDGVLQVLGATGDSRLMWDRRNPDEVAVARAAFDTARARGALVYKAEGKEGTRGEQVREFDETAERLIVVPALQGG